MRLRNLAPKALEWCAYWLPSLTIGLLSFPFALRRKELPPNPNILVMLIEHLGDIVVTTPMLRGLRTAHPNAKITIVVSHGGHALIEHCPFIDKIITVPPSPTWLGQLRRALRISRLIRPLDIDLAIIPKDAHNTDFNELICLLSACKWRVSRARQEFLYRIKPLKFRPLYDELIIDNHACHEVEARLEFAQRLTTQILPNRLESWLAPDDIEFADHFISHTIQNKNKIFAFGVSASAGGRQWPAENYAKLIEILGHKSDIAPLLIIGPSDVALSQEIARLTKSRVYFSATSTVRQSIALLQRCTIFIGNDSGPMHMAAAANIPVVEISAHPLSASSRSINSPVRFGPYGVKRAIIQPPPLDEQCAHNGCVSKYSPHCILQITPEQVASAVNRLLE